MAAPGTEASCGRMKLLAWSNSADWERRSLESASWMIGNARRVEGQMVGGVMPAGSCFKTVWDSPATSARAALIFTVGWKNILMMP